MSLSLLIRQLKKQTSILNNLAKLFHEITFSQVAILIKSYATLELVAQKEVQSVLKRKPFAFQSGLLNFELRLELYFKI